MQEASGSRFRGRVVGVGDLSPVDRDHMFDILDRHFLRVTRERFDADLAGKSWAVLLEDPAGPGIVGFTTLVPLEVAPGGPAGGERVRAVYSGDTIIDRSAWGDREMGRVWLRFMLELAARDPGRPLYWYLTSMGHRTYRLMELFFSDFHPRRDTPLPGFEARLLDTLGRTRFGEAYDTDRGLLHFDPPRECLRPEIGGTPETRINPTIAFFLERNPGHREGDELTCLARVSPANLTRFGRRLVGFGPSGPTPPR